MKATGKWYVWAFFTSEYVKKKLFHSTYLFSKKTKQNKTNKKQNKQKQTNIKLHFAYRPMLFWISSETNLFFPNLIKNSRLFEDTQKKISESIDSLTQKCLTSRTK